MMKNNIMLRKIILPLVLLIFAQQNFYGMNNLNNSVKFWENINNWVNKDVTREDGKYYPKLWWLWAFLDNVPFQYGNSKVRKPGEAYYGLSNGIGFFPSFLNFGWLKIGIVDAHINVINTILDYIKNFINCKTKELSEIIIYLAPPILTNVFFNIHIISVKILNCIKIKLVAPLALLIVDCNSFVGNRGNKDSTAWYITYNEDGQVSWWYALLSPRIELNISEIINYFNGK